MTQTMTDIPDDYGQDKPVDRIMDDTPIIQTNDGNNARASWPVSLHNLRTNISHMRAEAKQVLVDCFLWCIQNGISKPEFAVSVKISDNTLYKIITGKYLSPTTRERMDLSEKQLASLTAWLEAQRAKSSAATEFVMTPTARKVWMACDLARESCTPAFIFAPSHVGKTMALCEYAKTHNHGRTIYVRIGAASGLGGLLRELARAIGVSYNTSKDKMQECIIHALAPNMLLILDEVHELLHTYRKESFFACIEVIREIHDRVGLGMVLVVTKIKWDEISQYRRSDLEQMFRRGVHRTALGTVKGQPLMADVSAILETHGLDMPSKSERIDIDGIVESPREILAQLSRDDGLKSICERLRYAKKLAKADGRTQPTWADFVTAHLIIKHNGLEGPAWE